jgi:putative endonuclease
MMKNTHTNKQYFIYILECSNNSLYTGYTTNVERRYQEHLEGTIKCKYTRSFPPRRLVAYWLVGDKLSETLKLERRIKKLTRKQKEELINYPDSINEIRTSILSKT